MRSARIKLKGRAYYHCTSRVVDRRMIMEDVEREKFYNLMRGCETFAGVNIITYAILSNHFHILLEVPQRIEVDEAEIRQRLPAIYDKSQIAQMEAQWQRWREQGLERLVEADMERFRARMYDLSEFMKTLKQRFSQWYNTREDRSGTLWEDRFTSVLIEPPNYNRRQRGVGTLATVAAYIDLNPVRAGLVKDSKDYRWCGYGEAMAGRAIAQRGLARLYDSSQKRTWGEISKIYCNLLYAVGRELENIRKLMADGAVSEEAVELHVTQHGKLSLLEALHCRLRYFTAGCIIGSKSFVNEMFAEFRHRFGKKRKSGARRLKMCNLEGIYSLRDLRLAPLGLPARRRRVPAGG